MQCGKDTLVTTALSVTIHDHVFLQLLSRNSRSGPHIRAGLVSVPPQQRPLTCAERGSHHVKGDHFHAVPIDGVPSSDHICLQ